MPTRSWILSSRPCMLHNRISNLHVCWRLLWSGLRTGPLPELQDPIYRTRRRYPLWLKQVAFTVALFTLIVPFVKVEATMAEVSFPRLAALVRSRSKEYDLSKPEECMEYFCIMIGTFFVVPKTKPGELEEFKNFLFRHLNAHPNQIRPIHVITMIVCQNINKIVQSRKEDPDGVLMNMMTAVDMLVRIGRLEREQLRWHPIKLLATGNRNLDSWRKKSKK